MNTNPCNSGMSQIKLTLTSDSRYVIAKTNSNPWDHTEKKEKTPPVLGHGMNFVRNFNKAVFSEIHTKQGSKIPW